MEDDPGPGHRQGGRHHVEHQLHVNRVQDILQAEAHPCHLLLLNFVLFLECKDEKPLFNRYYYLSTPNKTSLDGVCGHGFDFFQDRRHIFY